MFIGSIYLDNITNISIKKLIKIKPHLKEKLYYFQMNQSEYTKIYSGYVPANNGFSKMTEKPVAMFPRTDAIKMAQRHQFHQLVPCGGISIDVKG